MDSPSASPARDEAATPFWLVALCVLTPALFAAALAELYWLTGMAWMGACACSVPALLRGRGPQRLRTVAASLVWGVAVSSAGIAWHQDRRPRYEADASIQVVHAGWPVQGVARIWCDPWTRDEAGRVTGFLSKQVPFGMPWDRTYLWLVANFVVCAAVAFAAQWRRDGRLLRWTQAGGAMCALPALWSASVFLIESTPYR